MILYEQDWLITVWETMAATRSNVTAGSSWLQAMSDAASQLDITIQYCMPLPRHMLESTRHQPVTNARASGDYHPGSSQFEISLSSLFYWSIGIAPSKDDYWTTEVQPGNPYGNSTSEPNWQLQAIVIALSTGPNGPSDGIGFTNASLVMSTVRGDGVTLQPDRPATIMDVALLAALAPGAPANSIPDVRSTWTAYGGHAYRFHHVLSTQLGSPFTFALEDLGPAGDATAFAVFDWFNPLGGPIQVLTTSAKGTITTVAATTPALSSFTIPHAQGQPSAPQGAHSIEHYIIIPQLPGGWWLFGEAGKVVPVSKQRIADLQVLADGFTATILGASGELAGVSILISAPGAKGALSPVLCPSVAQKTATLTCTAGACTCG